MLLVGIVVARVIVRLGRRWLGDDFLGADAASMIVTTLDGLVLVALAAVAVGLRRAIGTMIGMASTVTASVPSATTDGTPPAPTTVAVAPSEPPPPKTPSL